MAEMTMCKLKAPRLEMNRESQNQSKGLEKSRPVKLCCLQRTCTVEGFLYIWV